MSAPVILLMGPTASGKTAVALELSKRLPLEIVSVDSAQVYRGMDIGTAKPDAATREYIPHHLIDLISPEQAYSAARFRSDALDAIAAIQARGRVAVLVGGTMLYFKSLREGLSALPGADHAVRARLDARAAAQGWPALHAELGKVDPVTAARLRPTDAQRIQRALEVYELSGQPLSALHGTRDAKDAPEYLAFALIPVDRTELHRRIAQRFDAMLAAGLIDEVRGLRARHALNADMPSMRCVGYRQVWRFLEGDGDRKTLRDRGVAATRQLAKRQLTWLRSMDAQAVDGAVTEIAQSIATRAQGRLEAGSRLAAVQ